MPESGAGLSPIAGRLRLLTKPRAEDLIGVLAEARRRQSDRARGTVKLPRCSHLADLAGARMLDLEPHLPAGRERTRERLLDVEDRTRRDPELFETRQPLVARGSTQVGLDQVGQLVLGGLAERIGRKPRVGRKLGRLNRFAESLVLGIGCDPDVEKSIAHCKRAVRRDRRVMVAFLDWHLAG